MRGDGQQVRSLIEKARTGTVCLLDLLPHIARLLRWAWAGVPAGPSEQNWQSILFTGREVARASVRGEGTVRRVDPLRFLTRFLRSGQEQLVLDPGLSSRFVLKRPMLRLLFREYALFSLERRGGGWVLIRSGRIQALELLNRAPQVPLYLTRADAVPRAGEEAAFRPWAEIARGCLQACTDSLLLHAGRQEQIALSPNHLYRLEGRASPLARVEQVMSRRQGAICGAEVSLLLSQVDRIWAPVMGGAVVPVRTDSTVIDLFTSAGHAENFLASSQSPAGELVQPRLVPTGPLFERLIRSQTPVVINAGWIHQWQVHHELLEPVRDDEPDEPAVNAGLAGSGGRGFGTE